MDVLQPSRTAVPQGCVWQNSQRLDIRLSSWQVPQNLHRQFEQPDKGNIMGKQIPRKYPHEVRYDDIKMCSWENLQ